MVKLLDSFEEGDFLWAVLEFGAGGSLSDFVAAQDQGLPTELVRRLFKQLLQGVDFIHRKGFAHCDIRCTAPNLLLLSIDCAFSMDNIVLNTEQNELKIVDFDLAERGKLTKDSSGMIKFMSPEVAGLVLLPSH